MNNQTLIERTQAAIAQNQKVLSLIERFPDLHEHRNRWNQTRLCSKHANTQVTNCEIRHNCGCCNDSRIEVWPYLEVDGQCIYSDPIPFTVGEHGGNAGGEVPDFGWETKLKQANIPQTIIDKVQAFFDANKQSDEDEDAT